MNSRICFCENNLASLLSTFEIRLVLINWIPCIMIQKPSCGKSRQICPELNIIFSDVAKDRTVWRWSDDFNENLIGSLVPLIELLAIVNNGFHFPSLWEVACPGTSGWAVLRFPPMRIHD